MIGSIMLRTLVRPLMRSPKTAPEIWHQTNKAERSPRPIVRAANPLSKKCNRHIRRVKMANKFAEDFFCHEPDIVARSVSACSVGTIASGLMRRS